MMKYLAQDAVNRFLIDVLGVDMNEIFPIRRPDYVLAFGKYKGKTIEEICLIDEQYLFWLMDHYFNIDLDALHKQ